MNCKINIIIYHLLPTVSTSSFPCPAANFYHSAYNPKTISTFAKTKTTSH